MLNSLDFNLNTKNYDKDSHTLTIKDKVNETYFLNFEDDSINQLKIEVINSDITIIENYKGQVKKVDFTINVDEKSKVNRCSIIVNTTSSQKIIRNINNNGQYQSMQIDLTNKNVDSIENINLNHADAYAVVIDGIYATNKSNKKYQTNLNHFIANCTSKAQIFAINNDNAHVSIFTDAYIKNGAVGTKTNQEGRIINLSENCNGIVLPNLHIDENDVEASHSCSVGSVNQDHMYYLESRGLSNSQAKNILIRGYFNPILENITNETVKEEIINVLEQRIG